MEKETETLKEHLEQEHGLVEASEGVTAVEHPQHLRVD
jgi:hypothetical protein